MSVNKRRVKLWLSVLAHLVAVLSVMMLTFFILDRVNEAMAFLNNEITKWILAVYALMAASLAVGVIVLYEKGRKEDRSGSEDKGERHDQE